MLIIALGSARCVDFDGKGRDKKNSNLCKIKDWNNY